MRPQRWAMTLFDLFSAPLLKRQRCWGEINPQHRHRPTTEQNKQNLLHWVICFKKNQWASLGLENANQAVGKNCLFSENCLSREALRRDCIYVRMLVSNNLGTPCSEKTVSETSWRWQAKLSITASSCWPRAGPANHNHCFFFRLNEQIVLNHVVVVSQCSRSLG